MRHRQSDLGKHEGSIKHSENAQRKALPVKENHTEAEGSGAGVMKWEYNEDEEGLLPYGTDPPDDETEEEEGEADETEVDCEEDDEQPQELEAQNDLPVPRRDPPPPPHLPQHPLFSARELPTPMVRNSQTPF